MNDEQKTQPDAPQQPADALQESYLRLRADFENYRKAESQRVQAAVQFGNERMVEDVLNVLDTRDAILAHVPDAVRSEHAAWLTGVEQFFQQIDTMLGAWGAQRIPIAVGAMFDPMTMEAVHMIPVDGAAEPHTVQQEVRAGYLLHGKVIRPARVIVYQ